MDMRMLHLSVILLFLPQTLATTSPNLTAGCRIGTAAECSKALFVPGHTLLGTGFNILTMKPVSSFVLDLQLIDPKCTLCNNPFQQNVLQKLPKSMVDWRPQSSCTRNVASSVHQSSISLANEGSSSVTNDWTVGISIPAKVANIKTSVGGSHSKMAKFADSRSVGEKYSFLSHKLECTYYSFGLNKMPALTSHFEETLKQLPKSYNKNTYRHLISRYGTHYIMQAEVGGRLQDVTAVRTCEVALDGMTMEEVKDCLSVEAEFSANVPKSPSLNAKYQRCSEKAKQQKKSTSYSQTFNDRDSEVTGGDVKYDLLSASNDPKLFDKWLDSLKVNPGLVSYALEPIHNLVRFQGPVKQNLIRAVNEYLNDYAIKKRCSCSGGSYVKPGEDCSCACSPTKHINSNCCPTNRGEAKLHVTIHHANGLWGDYVTKTDAYVKIKFGSEEARTHTIWNNDNPVWNRVYDFNTVELAPNNKLTIEVWDEDNKYDDDLLGKCVRDVASGSHFQTCYLNNGKITFTIKADCSPYLTGRYCRDYRRS